MHGVVLQAALVFLAFSVLAWLALSVTIVLGRVVHDRRQRAGRVSGPLDERESRRLVRRASGQPRTEWGRWRRMAALARLSRARHRAAPRLLRRALASPDPRIAIAAIRGLGDLGDDFAVDVLLSALQDGRGPRSRIAAELERLAPLPRPALPALLRDWNPQVRYWGATLLARYPNLARQSLIALSRDPDPNVRAATAETLGTRTGEDVEAVLLDLLDDPVWYVRVHAARAVGQVVGAPAAPALCQLLADEKWWVRTAAKDALRMIGIDAVPALLSALMHVDRFARNGAAEVLQDIGFVDSLAADEPESPILGRIYAAGGDRLRLAAERRAAVRPKTRKVRAA